MQFRNNPKLGSYFPSTGVYRLFALGSFPWLWIFIPGSFTEKYVSFAYYGPIFM